MDFYLIIVISLIVLATADLIVGVSNDAVNFLNSAVGSKAISFKTIMIIASLGVCVGAVFSSGLMEVARKGIFNPDLFYFDEIMVLFMAVMITDIILLDFFNSLGLPTSTTVSIVFELLGAAVAISLIKIYSGEYNTLIDYINIGKASQIILGIFLSIIIAFSVGAVVQYITRLILSFKFRKKPKWVNGIFGALSMTSLTYFILVKGIKGTPFADTKFNFLGGLLLEDFIANHTLLVVTISLVVWINISLILVYFFKNDIYKTIIIVGTFSLALAFAGNDLVNFIGVPIAAWQSFTEWKVSGLNPELFNMSFLSSKVSSPTLVLIFAGLVMVVTLWFSKKAKKVLKTSIDLSNQNKVNERFQANFLSDIIVTCFIKISKNVEKFVPEKINLFIAKQFDNSFIENKFEASEDSPAFDNVRASINLTIAAILISLATSYKLPLSTTYVTFMVAMGTSLADKAWGSESASYRVAGVINVICGWFLTAFVAFTICGIIAVVLFYGKLISLSILIILAAILFINNQKNK